jgi:hypothetical protein
MPATRKKKVSALYTSLRSEIERWRSRRRPPFHPDCDPAVRISPHAPPPCFFSGCDLNVLPAFQNVGDIPSQTFFAIWFDALEYMKEEIARRDFDVAPIGAGAYGVFVAAECKRRGEAGIHIGGATQLLLGILGKRWTDPSSPDSSSVLPFINEHWTGPTKAEIPAGASKVEGGCYWV